MMKAELVNLVTKNGTETVVLLSTDVEEVTDEERIRVVELAVWLADEGWTVATVAESPLAEVVRRGVEAMRGTYLSLCEIPGVWMTPSPDQLPPQIG